MRNTNIEIINYYYYVTRTHRAKKPGGTLKEDIRIGFWNVSFKHCCEITVNRRKKLFQASEREHICQKSHLHTRWRMRTRQKNSEGPLKEKVSVFGNRWVSFFKFTSINSESEFADTCTGQRMFFQYYKSFRKTWNRKDSRSNVLEQLIKTVTLKHLMHRTSRCKKTGPGVFSLKPPTKCCILRGDFCKDN